MKKMIFTSLILITVGGLAAGCQGGGQSFDSKTSFAANGLQTIEINNDSWDIELKNTESRQITIACEGKRHDKKSDPGPLPITGVNLLSHSKTRGAWKDLVSAREALSIYPSLIMKYKRLQ
ncbi:hypothetical protein ABEX25_25115 [Paenibacillus thiaminolyticus]|uniref:DUF4097 family beta strand repeat-containing protein n=1 Tax=Paenibacillus thiaminolyticus TaxID=49283 RepID=UPI003D28071F